MIKLKTLLNKNLNEAPPPTDFEWKKLSGTPSKKMELEPEDDDIKMQVRNDDDKKKEELIQLLKSSGFTENTKFSHPTYTKITDGGEFSFVFRDKSKMQMTAMERGNQKINSTTYDIVVYKPTEDVITEFDLEKVGDIGWYYVSAPKPFGFNYSATLHEPNEKSVGEEKLEYYLSKIKKYNKEQ